jgi:predicted RNase H-like HicB family nuclease
MVEMKKKPTYTAVFARGRDGVWEVELVDEPRVHTFGRTLVKARTYIREATAAWFDADVEAFDIVEDVRLPKTVKDRVARAVRERERAQAAQESALTTTRQAAEALVRTGHLSTRDAAELLGLSHQRVQQLLAS